MARLFWTQRQNMGPVPRQLHAMAYDSQRQQTVLFGGHVELDGQLHQPIGDTWQWNGEFWTQLEDIGPSARAMHAMAYDAARAHTVLFGGSTTVGLIGSAPQGDTWAWDGQAWTQLADTGPSARTGAAIAFDSDRKRILLFGGDGNADTWEWDGEEWTQTADDGPPGRAFGAMAYDSVRKRHVLFGGVRPGSGREFLNDTWEFADGAWTRVSDIGPPRRNNSAMVFTGASSLLFGGEIVGPDAQATSPLKDTWEWSGKHWTQRQDIGPKERARHQMVFDEARRRVVLFGGTSDLNAGPNFGDTWELPV